MSRRTEKKKGLGSGRGMGTSRARERVTEADAMRATVSFPAPLRLAQGRKKLAPAASPSRRPGGPCFLRAVVVG